MSRQTVRKYAQLEDCSPEPPARPAAVSKLDPYKPLIGKWLEADRFMPRKQRHTARRVYDRLVEEQGFDGSYQIVQRYVKRWRQEHRLPGDGYPGLEWSPGVMQADFGLRRPWWRGAGRTCTAWWRSVSVFEHWPVRGGVPGENAECVCEVAARGVRAHRRRAAGAGARQRHGAAAPGSRGTGSWWWRCSRGSSAHHRIEVRFWPIRARGNEKGQRGVNAVGSCAAT